MTANGKGKLLEWPIEKLWDHPLHEAVFGPVSEADLTALTADIKARGLNHRVEILPNGCIIKGRKRVRAARRLEWPVVPVIVRHDLAAKGEAAIKAEIIKDNLVRQHLTRLTKARCIQELMADALKCKNWNLDGTKKDKLKAEIGKQLGLSGRNVSRYLLALQAPLVVQHAFDLGEVTLVDAGKVALLAEADQKKVARRIEAGEPARRVVGEALAGMKGGTSSSDAAEVTRSFNRLALCIKRELVRLDGCLHQIGQGRLLKYAALLEEAEKLMGRLVRLARRKSG